MAENVYAIFPNENYVDLSLYQFGYEECEPMHSFGPAARNHFLFHYILSGKGLLMSTDDKGETHDYYLESGQGFLIWPKQRNTYSADEKDPWVYTWVEFDGLKAQELVAQAGLAFNYPIYVSHDLEEREKMKNEMHYIVGHRDAEPLDLIGHLYLFMSALINSSSMKKRLLGGNLKEFYVREALVYIEAHFHENIHIEDIAAFCNLNRSYLGKIFRAATNMTPQAFLIQFRMNKACELMKISDRPIKEISAMVGYPNQLNFSRTFKQFTGVSPREWRTQNKLR